MIHSQTTKLNIGKCVFSVAAPTIWNQLPIAIKSSETTSMFHENSKHDCVQLHIHDTFWAIPRSNDDYCLFLFMMLLMILKSTWHLLLTLQQDLQIKNRALDSPQDI